MLYFEISEHNKHRHSEEHYYLLHRKLFYVDIKYKQRRNDYHKALKDERKGSLRYIVPAEVEQRKYHSVRSNGKPLIFLSRLVALTLTLFLGLVLV